MQHHLIAISRLQGQIGHEVTAKEATYFLIILIVAALAFAVKKSIFS